MMSAVGEGRLFVLVADLYIPANRKASELLADGELGEPVTADWVATDWPHSPFGGPGAGERSWPNSDAGLLANRGYGALVLLQRWLGPAISVSASATPRAETLSLQTECGALGQLTAVAAVAGDVAVERRLIGSDAALLIRDDPEDEIALGGFVDGLFQPIKVHHTPYVQRHATRLAIQDILECIVGEAEPELSNAEALRAMSVLDAARASIETSRCVEILGD